MLTRELKGFFLDSAAEQREFDPWTATATDGSRVAESDPSALAKHEAAQEVARSRATCLSPGGGTEVIRCVALCLANDLRPPQWLSDAFIERRARVAEAYVKSWDSEEAFGAPWPPRARLESIRRRKKLKSLVHQAVWDMVVDDGFGSASVNRDLFERIGKYREIAASGSLCEEVYYEALREGLPNPLDVSSGLLIKQM